MIRRPPRSTQSRSSAASDVYKRQGMHHCVNALHRPPEPVLVAHIPDEVAELGVVARWKVLGHLVLLELVSGVDDHPGDPWVFVQDDFNELVPEGAGAAGDEDTLCDQGQPNTLYG